MWLRIAAHFGIAFLPLTLGKKRAHPRNISRNTELTLRSRIQVWEKARHQFSGLVPVPLLHTLLADVHLQLGYLLLAKDQRKEARQIGLKSLTYAIRHLAPGESPDKSLPDYRWLFGMGLIMFTFIGWPITRLLWRTKNILFRKDNGSANN
jgi:hypothetical protein